MRLPALVVTSFGLIDHGVVGGILKSMQIDKIHNMHAPKFQGRVFSEVAEAPQAAPTRRTLVGEPEWHIMQYMTNHGIVHLQFVTNCK